MGGSSLSNADDLEDNDVDNGHSDNGLGRGQWKVTISDDSKSTEAGTSSHGLDNVREIGEMDEDKFYMLRGIV